MAYVISRTIPVPSAGDVSLSYILEGSEEELSSYGGRYDGQALVANLGESDETRMADLGMLDDFLHARGSSLEIAIRDNRDLLFLIVAWQRLRGRMVEDIDAHRFLYESVPDYVTPPALSEGQALFWVVVILRPFESAHLERDYLRGVLSFQPLSLELITPDIANLERIAELERAVLALQQDNIFISRIVLAGHERLRLSRELPDGSQRQLLIMWVDSEGQTLDSYSILDQNTKNLFHGPLAEVIRITRRWLDIDALRQA